MNTEESPLDTLPAWCLRHGVDVHPAVKAADVKERGNGWVVSRAKGPLDAGEEAALLHIPRNVILSAGYVERFAASNEHFKHLLEALPEVRSESRLLEVLFMLVQLAFFRSTEHGNGNEDTEAEPWRQYMLLQPLDVPVPTMWSDAERSLLKGTSLESTVSAKLALLTREFAMITAKTREMPFWREVLCHPVVSLRDWIWLDSLFRSRSFDLPSSGESMVPCLDLANHSSENTAYFQQDTETGSVSLLLHKDKDSVVSAGDELTISYGNDKPAAEMLFNYGFIDHSRSTLDGESLVLSLDESPLWKDWAHDDPLLAAKLDLFNDAPMLQLSIDHAGVARLTCPFVYLMCVREEDGFSFKREGEHATGRCTLSWQGKDMSRMIGMLGLWLNARRELRNVIQARAVDVLLAVVKNQVMQLRRQDTGIAAVKDRVKGSVLQSVEQLRKVEMAVLERAVRALEAETNELRE